MRILVSIFILLLTPSLSFAESASVSNVLEKSSSVFSDEEISMYLHKIREIIQSHENELQQRQAHFQFEDQGAFFKATLSPAMEAQIDALVYSIGEEGIRRIVIQQEQNTPKEDFSNQSKLEKTKRLVSHKYESTKTELREVSRLIKEIIENPKAYTLIGSGQAAYLQMKWGVALSIIFGLTYIPYTAVTEVAESFALGAAHVWCTFFQVIYFRYFGLFVEAMQLPGDLLKKGKALDLPQRLKDWHQGKSRLDQIIARAIKTDSDGNLKSIFKPQELFLFTKNFQQRSTLLWYFLNPELTDRNAKSVDTLSFEQQAPLFSNANLTSDQLKLELQQWVQLMRQLEIFILEISKIKNLSQTPFSYIQNWSHWSSLGKVSRSIAKWERQAMALIGELKRNSPIQTITTEDLNKSKSQIFAKLFELHDNAKAKSCSQIP